MARQPFFFFFFFLSITHLFSYDLHLHPSDFRILSLFSTSFLAAHLSAFHTPFRPSSSRQTRNTALITDSKTTDFQPSLPSADKNKILPQSLFGLLCAFLWAGALLFFICGINTRVVLFFSSMSSRKNMHILQLQRGKKTNILFNFYTLDS